MSTRLSAGGRLINRQSTVRFRWNGKNLRGFHGDTLASALLANNEMMVGRSFKYHRPRGIIASGCEDPNALVGLGENGRFEPNQRATTTELFQGLSAVSQNAWPSLQFDIMGVNRFLGRFLPAGFYYKTFMHPRAAWKHVFEPLIRHSAGMGLPPKHKDIDSYEHFYAHVDVFVAGGGIAGLAAAYAAACCGAKVLLAEQTAHFGGRAVVDQVKINDEAAEIWVVCILDCLAKMPNVTIHKRMMVAGVYDHGFVLAYENLGDHKARDFQADKEGYSGLRHRLWRIRAKRIIAANGAFERPLCFANNDCPGVMLASAMRDYIVNFAVSTGDRIVIATNNDDAYRTAIVLSQAGLLVPAVVDARSVVQGDLIYKARALGIQVLTGRGIAKVKGHRRVTAVSICAQAGEGAELETITCDGVAMSGGWSPAVHLWSHCGGKLTWKKEQGIFCPDMQRPPRDANGDGFVLCAGTANGYLAADAALEDAINAGLKAARDIGYHDGGVKNMPQAMAAKEDSIVPICLMPQGMNRSLQAKAFLDYQNDVKVSDIRLAAREGYESVEHAKRYTTLGMATDQGKLSNINGLTILADSLGTDISAVGTTTFRPPFQPISMGSIAGESRGTLFKVTRKTPMHEWHTTHGGFWEPVADWQRVYCYLNSGESVEDAVRREILNTRQNCGLLDASTLGKIIVKGPDADKFLDMLYTNMMSTLPVGRCRYGLMCNENGFLSDDGVVARLNDEMFLCHTTSGGSDRIYATMEEWLQTEWWNWQVYIANITEQYAQIAVVGPNARKVLQKLTGMDVSTKALPFMTFKKGTLADMNVRVYRISFSGELSYEIAVRASEALEFWQACLEAGSEFGIAPYGTECLHVMRAEKGFIMIGDETDGTVTPQDLGLHWAVSKKKSDFIGKRGQQRRFLTADDRWCLVGLKPLIATEILPDGIYAVDGTIDKNGIKNTIGRVTSSYFSPTLDYAIALGLVQRGRQRLGEVIEFPTLDEKVIKAKICNPVFFDKKGKRQNV